MKTMLLFLFCIMIFNCFAEEPPQNRRYENIDVYSIVDEGLGLILDSIILHEQLKGYYYQDIRFDIISEDSLILIQALGYGIFSDDLKGVVKRSEHDFLIYGKVNSQILKKTGNQIALGFRKSLSYKDKKTGKFVFDYDLDDGMSRWIYKYKNGNFEQVFFYDSKIKKKNNP